MSTQRVKELKRKRKRRKESVKQRAKLTVAAKAKAARSAARAVVAKPPAKKGTGAKGSVAAPVEPPAAEAPPVEGA